MRRPHSPGGRFLTSKEISSQKFHNGHASSPSTLRHDHVDDEEVLGLDYSTSVPMLRPRDSYPHALDPTSVNQIDLSYHPSQSHTPPDHRNVFPSPNHAPHSLPNPSHFHPSGITTITFNMIFPTCLTVFPAFIPPQELSQCSHLLSPPIIRKLSYIIFCGGSDVPDEDLGNYSHPAINSWDYPASTDCQRITLEPADGSTHA